MIRSFFIHLGLIFIFIGASWAILLQYNLVHTATPVTPKPSPPRFTIALAPLDSRPPCTDYVQKLAAMADLQVSLPPAILLDNYRQPGDTAQLRNWLSQEAVHSAAAIVSVDMLVHGGLLASRQGNEHHADAAATIQLLRTIHLEQPQVRLFAFNIIPRLFIADNPLTDKFKPQMSDWAILQETVRIFENPADVEKLRKLEAELPSELIEHYRNLYRANRQLNSQLLELVQEGTLAGLVLGQDDSAPFGLGNLERQWLDAAISHSPLLQSRVFVTRGTDEVALSLLGQVIADTTAHKNKVYVHYTEATTADRILPYMPGPLSRTVTEKLAISNTEQSSDFSVADYILVIHAGTIGSRRTDMEKSADLIKGWLATGKQVALVDLAADWRTDQTLLPFLQRNETPLQSLIAYAGWNTASNSIGTAVTQAAMVLSGNRTTSANSPLHRDLQRVGFLAERMLDDWYYQKSFRHVLNDSLQRRRINPYDLQSTRNKVNQRIELQLADTFPQLVGRQWQNSLFALPTPSQGMYAIATWRVTTSLPWDRTFEIRLETTPLPALVNERR
jgi:hypothetical protein